MDIAKEKIHALRDMAPDEHVEQAYRLMAESAAWEQEGINATLAVAHLLLADRKERAIRPHTDENRGQVAGTLYGGMHSYR